MKNKVLFLTSEELRQYSGVSKKIYQQVDSLRGMGYCVDLVHVYNSKIFINDSVICDLRNGVMTRSFYYLCLYKYFIDDNSYDIIYIRNSEWQMPFGFHGFMKMLSYKSKIILEIPTYPYKGELKSLHRIIVNFLYEVIRKKTAHNIDMIICIGDSNHEMIWGVHTIEMTNGFDSNSVPLKSNMVNVSKNFNFIGVARLTYWHGYDRLVKSIFAYKQKCYDTNINFYLIGDGKKVLNDISLLVKKMHLEDNVHICGPLTGDDLNYYYDIAHVAVDSLGRHRSGINKNSSLKSKEYLSRGLPIIMSHFDVDLLDLPYVYNVAPEDDIFDIRSVINWYLSLSVSSHEIRNYAINAFSWKDRFMRVFDSL